MGTSTAGVMWVSPLLFPSAKVEQVKFDATTLYAKPQMAAQQKMVDDGSGEVEVGWPGQNVRPSWGTPWAVLGDIMVSRGYRARGCTSPGSSMFPSHQVWRVENQELVPVDKRWLGHFYGGDCYLVLYTYFVGPKVNRIIYLWQVRPQVTDHRWATGASLHTGGGLLLCMTPWERHEGSLFPRGKRGLWWVLSPALPCPGPPSQHR